MLIRRALALITVLTLLFTLGAIPRGPILVCRITGTPMAPVTVSKAGPGDNCCTITVAASAGKGAPHLALSAPGCCELRQDNSPPPAPAVTTNSPETPAVALLPAVPSLPVPEYVTLTDGTMTPRESSPRAPPLRFAPPRAPPVFS